MFGGMFTLSTLRGLYEKFKKSQEISEEGDGRERWWVCQEQAQRRERWGGEEEGRGGWGEGEEEEEEGRRKKRKKKKMMIMMMNQYGKERKKKNKKEKSRTEMRKRQTAGCWESRRWADKLHWETDGAMPVTSSLALALARVPLQDLVMKFFPEFSPASLRRAVGLFGWSVCWSFFCSECPSKTSPKTLPKTSPQTSPWTAHLQNSSFAQNFALQKLFANTSTFASKQQISAMPAARRWTQTCYVADCNRKSLAKEKLAAIPLARGWGQKRIPHAWSLLGNHFVTSWLLFAYPLSAHTLKGYWCSHDRIDFGDIPDIQSLLCRPTGNLHLSKE